MKFIIIILPILIGAFIGYCTNYIAIKMLFHPRREIRLFGMKLPFTPGVIPKNRGRIARAAGAAISERLVTKDALTAELKKSEIKNSIVDGLMSVIDRPDESIGDITEKLIAQDAAEMFSNVGDTITCKVTDALGKLDFTSIISEIAGSVLMEKLQGTMMAMFINESTISSIVAPVGEYVEQYIERNGYVIIYPMVEDEINKTIEMTPDEALKNLGLLGGTSSVRVAVENAYDRLADRIIGDAAGKFNVSGLVEDKINEMNVEELEDMVLSVMKNELQMVINLGAVIGAIIGILNIFI